MHSIPTLCTSLMRIEVVGSTDTCGKEEEALVVGPIMCEWRPPPDHTTRKEVEEASFTSGGRALMELKVAPVVFQASILRGIWIDLRDLVMTLVGWLLLPGLVPRSPSS
ncbi:hypothetical protein R1sor_021249 [Riccia sorocarpa]|uniref:Uncharacterized protein n=1 Tax=Riccia sorocarpa TaxID=122646 RepID=A0ABD3GH91_9MARC